MLQYFKTLLLPILGLAISITSLQAGALREEGQDFSNFAQQFKRFGHVQQSRKAGRTIIESGQALPKRLDLSSYSHPGSKCVKPASCVDHKDVAKGKTCPTNCSKPCCAKECAKKQACGNSKNCPSGCPKACCVKKCSKATNCDKNTKKCGKIKKACNKESKKCDKVKKACDKESKKCGKKDISVESEKASSPKGSSTSKPTKLDTFKEKTQNAFRKFIQGFKSSDS
jgi:hypothetical protein